MYNHRYSSGRLIVVGAILMMATLYALGKSPAGSVRAQVELTATPTSQVTPIDTNTPFPTAQATPTPSPLPPTPIPPDKPSKVTLVSPEDGIFITTTSPNLSWNAATFGNTYHLQVSTKASFVTVVVDAMTGSLSYIPTSLMEGKLYWRVQAVNSLGVAGHWSESRVFIVDSIPPDVPVQTSPYDGEFIHDRTPRLSVKSEPDAVLYNFVVDPDCEFRILLIDVVVATNSYTPASEIPEGRMCWKVRARDDAGNWSELSLYDVFIILPPGVD